MNPIRLQATRALPPTCRPLVSSSPSPLRARPSRRLASSDSSHGSSSTHSPPNPQTESFGLSFYVLALGVPAAVLIYNLTRDADASSNPITAFIAAYTTSQEAWQERNALHTRMVEQAAHDRNLFANTPAPVFSKLRFPEAINNGSPMNHHAGHSRANLDELVALYRDKAFAEEEEKLRRMREGTLPGQANAASGQNQKQ